MRKLVWGREAETSHLRKEKIVDLYNELFMAFRLQYLHIIM